MPLCPSPLPACLHDATGGQGVGDLAGAGWLAVLTHSLVAAAVSVPTPLHRPAGVGGQAAQNAGVDGESSQTIVSEQHRLTPACGAGNELVLGAGLVEDLQAFLTHRVQAGEDAGTLPGKVVCVAAGGAVQWFTGHDRPWGGGRWRSGGGGGGGAQYILVDDDVVHLVVELMVADFIGTGFPLRQEAVLPAHDGGRRGHHRPCRPWYVQSQVTAGLVHNDFPFTATVPRHSRRRGVPWLGDGHRAFSRELLRLNYLHGVHGDGDRLAPKAGHSHSYGILRRDGCCSNQHLTPCFLAEEDQTPSLRSASRGDMGTEGALHVSFRDPPSAWVSVRRGSIEELSQSNTSVRNSNSCFTAF